MSAMTAGTVLPSCRNGTEELSPNASNLRKITPETL